MGEVILVGAFRSPPIPILAMGCKYTMKPKIVWPPIRLNGSI